MTTRTRLRREVLARIDEWQAKLIAHNIEKMRADGVCETAIAEFVQMSRERNARFRREDVEDLLDQIDEIDEIEYAPSTIH
jgi:hypothetical protein